MTGQVDQVTVPTLVVFAEKDSLSKQEAYNLAEKLSTAELVIIAEGTHLLNESHPTKMARVISKLTTKVKKQ